jgi:formylglycine-generating enzyme required for sulfatase activity
MARLVTVFFSYSHKNKRLRDQLERHLSVLKRQHLVGTWYDRKIEPGRNIEREIDQHLQTSDLILLLISPDFLASDYCWSKEMMRAIERHDAGEAIVIPIILVPCDWHEAPFGRLKALPTDGVPVVDRRWKNTDTAFAQIANELRQTVNTLQHRSALAEAKTEALPPAPHRPIPQSTPAIALTLPVKQEQTETAEESQSTQIDTLLDTPSSRDIAGREAERKHRESPTDGDAEATHSRFRKFSMRSRQGEVIVLIFVLSVPFAIWHYRKDVNPVVLWQRLHRAAPASIQTPNTKTAIVSRPKSPAQAPLTSSAATPTTSTGPIKSAKPELQSNLKDNLEYVHLPGGTYAMGCSTDDEACFSDEKPQHLVTVSAFWIGKTEITQDAYYSIIPGENKSRFQGHERPAENLTWDDADAYCKAVGMRLPTEAEWEYAARGDTSSARYGPLDEIAWHPGNSGSETHPVGQKQPNAWGLYDMLGNAWEWVSDSYTSRAQSASAKESRRVVRGGSCCFKEATLGRSERVSNRFGLPPKAKGVVGARCAGATLPKAPLANSR